MKLSKIIQYGLLGLVLGFLALFLLLPVFTVLEVGCDWTLLSEVFRNYVYREGVFNSFRIALVTTFFVLVISVPLALLYDRFEFPGKSFCAIAVMLPMILPPFVGALGFQQLLGHYGVFNSILVSLGFGRIDFLGGEGKFWSVCFIEALHLYPILYLNLVTALGNLDPAMNEAARNLGAGWFFRFRRVTLPLMRPGLFAGGSLVFIWSFTELGTPLMFGFNRTTAVQIFNGITELETNAVVYALVLVMLTFSGLIYLAGKLLLGRPLPGGMVKGNAGGSALCPAGWRKFLPGGVFAAVTALAALPHIALIFTAFFLRWYGTVLPERFTWLHFENALSNKMVIPSIVNSLRYSTLAMILAVIAGVVIALALCRWRIYGAFLADLLVMMSLAVPGIVIAFGYLGMAVKYHWAGALFNPVENPLWLLAVAYAVRRLPYVVRSVSSGLEQISEELENAGRNFGAGAWMVLRRITLPLVTANLIVGGLFAFSFSMLEVSDSLILAQKAVYYPITKAIYELSQILGTGPYVACAFGVWAMLFLASTLGAAAWILGKKVGAAFRL